MFQNYGAPSPALAIIVSNDKYQVQIMIRIPVKVTIFSGERYFQTAI